jgi:hypothetical protein
MTDPASAARTARESLARGLAILQSPGVPPHLLDVAEPVAQAMGALHRIESSGGGALDQAPAALDAVRRALAQLQASAGAHPAVDQAMEAVAGSLGLVHGLTQVQPAAAAQAAPAAPAPVAPAPVAPAAAAPNAALGGTMVMGDQAAAAAPQAAPQQAAPQYQQQQPAAPQYQQQQPFPQPAPAAAPQYQPQQPATPQYQQQQQQYPQAAGYGPPPAAAAAGAPWGNAPQQHQQPQQPQQPQAQPPAGSWPQHAAPQPPQAASAPHHPAPAPPGPVPGVQVPPGVPRVDADLGAHSPSNFYKGLSGNDVIECGGIFVATYKIPKIGTNLAIKVALPGGYEFEALGVVEWVREAPNSTAGLEAPPGFGAKFTQISPEGRQLVYRYVRNREPLFHDDL